MGQPQRSVNSSWILPLIGSCLRLMSQFVLQLSPTSLYSPSTLVRCCQSVPLSGGRVVTEENGVRVVIVLLDSDITAIKLNEQLATAVHNTYPSVEPSANEDRAENLMELITSHATAFVLDATRPQLISFTLNMIQGVLNLTFDDTMLACSFDSTAFRVQSTMYAMSNRYYTLTSSITNSSNR